MMNEKIEALKTKANEINKKYPWIKTAIKIVGGVALVSVGYIIRDKLITLDPQPYAVVLTKEDGLELVDILGDMRELENSKFGTDALGYDSSRTAAKIASAYKKAEELMHVAA